MVFLGSLLSSAAYKITDLCSSCPGKSDFLQGLTSVDLLSVVFFLLLL